MSNPKGLRKLTLPQSPPPTSVPMTGSSADPDAEILADIRASAGAGRREHTSIPPALRALAFTDLDASEGRGEVILALQAWSFQGGGIMLCGPPGSGKTRMAATAAWAALERRTVAWVSVPRAAHALGADFKHVDRELILPLLTRSVGIVLDDLGQEQTSEPVRALLHAAIDLRLAEGLPLLVTSNFKPSELGARYGAWLASRLTGYCRAYRVLGRDRRLDP